MTEPEAGHPAVDVLCDLDAGVLDGTAGHAELHAHVAGCAACAAVIAMFADLRRRLAGLPDAPMPADVAERIDTALTAETNRTGDRPPAPSAAVSSLQRQRVRRSRWLPGGGAVAAGIALLAAAAIGIGAWQSQDGQHATTSGAADNSKSRPAPQVQAAGVRNYNAATLAAAVRLLASRRGNAAGQGTSDASPLALAAPSETAATAPLARLRSAAPLAACVAALTGRPGVTPLAVDYALFQGQPVLIVVLPDSDPSLLQAWLVGPACTTSQPDLRRYEVVPRAG